MIIYIKFFALQTSEIYPKKKNPIFGLDYRSPTLNLIITNTIHLFEKKKTEEKISMMYDKASTT